MYLPKDASRLRVREAQNARENRHEVVKALSQGTITRRDVYKWGLFGLTGALMLKNGFSPFAPSAFASGGSDIPTGTPRSPLFGSKKFDHRLVRLALQKPVPITQEQKLVTLADGTQRTENVAVWGGEHAGEPDSHRLSYHTDFDVLRDQGMSNMDNPFVNPVTGRGPMEGRPPGEVFAHQRWDEFFPKVGYVMNWGRIAAGTKFCQDATFPEQNPESVWTYGSGKGQWGDAGGRTGTLPPFLIQGRYGEPIITRVYNTNCDDPSHEDNGGFGRNESQFHFHNAHNGAESDGAANVHHFPGTFYDYRWSTALARRDKTNTQATDPRASGPDDDGGLVNVAGDWREIQGTMWAHDHRFYFTAENVYKGNLGMVTYYSGRDRGNEQIGDGVNIRLPSGYANGKGWGNIDFDVNLIIRDAAWDADGQLYFDIFTTDGFCGDVMLVNEQYAPFMDVLPRKYRFRTLSAGMSRWIRQQWCTSDGRAVPDGAVTFIANDGNLIVNPAVMKSGLLPVQGTAERFDIIVDFSKFPVGTKIWMVNVLQHDNGLLPKQTVSLGTALKGVATDPAVGPMIEFRVASEVESVDMPGLMLKASDPDYSQLPTTLTEQIPLVTPVRTRVIEWGRGGDTSLTDPKVPGSCVPDCGTEVTSFPWTVKVNGGASHAMNANRVSMVYPKPGEIEHWTYKNGGGGWDHPIHLHFEEGVTFQRNGQKISDPTENLVRKDVWRLGPSGSVTFQIQFGEFAGSYVQHCHNTVHEDFALLMRLQLLNGIAGTPQFSVTDTPNPSRDGVTFTTPEVLKEGDPRVSG